MCGECGCCRSHHHEEEQWGHEHERRRQFLTKAEKAEKLKKYAEELRKELAAVEECVKELNV
jgi:hypothetical protein